MTQAAATLPISPRRRFWITVAVMSASIMQVLDTTILNVALPNMAGELSATPDQISWVLTSYLIAAGLFMTMTGYFADRFGQKTYMLASIFSSSSRRPTRLRISAKLVSVPPSQRSFT